MTVSERNILRAILYGGILLFLGYIIFSGSVVEDQEYYEETCAELVAYLERERETKGVYPSAIPQSLARCLRPNGAYHQLNEGAGCTIQFGDYTQDGRAVYWESDKGWWTNS
jgi:hypothetical protein